MFEAKVASALVLKKIIDSIKDLVTEVNLDITSEGIGLQAMDSSHVALVSLMLHQKGFCDYNLEKPTTIGICITNLAKVMKLASNDDEITLGLADDPTHLKVTFVNRKQEKKTQFDLNLLTLDSEHLGIPDTNYTSEIMMNSFEFSKLIKELNTLCDTVTIETTIEYVRFSLESDVGIGNIQIQTSEPNEKKEDGAEDPKDDAPVVQSFALKYLNMFNKASCLSNSVKLMMAAETPLVVEFEIEDLGELKYYLAPKVNQDTSKD
ncbi:unnamed protein product [Moneuplotes crassus]|uniref:DNA sliding clamp PCNA n=1 Tax=Euplotes crassus TaxID=5936 RepID=A0AAD1XVN3_EUPCR|nr:unnamed protein product [Moneuplotes crassus]